MVRLARLALVLVATLTTSVSAQEIVVTTDLDEFGENMDACSLREAVQAANTSADFGGCTWPGADVTIRLEADRYRFERDGEGEDDNEVGDLDIYVPLRIAGSQMGETTINGRFFDRVLHIHGVDVTLEDVRIRHGRLRQDASGLDGGHGGGILATDADLTLRSVVFTENRAGDGDKGSPGGRGGDGGGLYLTGGSVEMDDVKFFSNRAGDGGLEEDDDGIDTTGGDGGHGGAAYIVGDLSLTTGLLEDNRAGDGGEGGNDLGDTSGGDAGDGGAFWVQGDVTIASAIFRRHRAGDGGSEAASSDNGGGGGDGGHGGTLYVHGDLSMTDVEIVDSRSGRGGDGYSPSAGSFSGPGGHGGAVWAQGGRFDLARGLLRDNQTSTGGTGQPGGSGGALYLDLSGEATLTEVRLDSNRTASGADERWDEEGAGRGGSGGAVWIQAAALRITTSSILDNATGSGGNADESPARGGAGGGVFFRGDSLFVVRSTFARNATGAGGNILSFGEGAIGGDGGGLYASDGFDPSLVTIESSTFSGNTTGAGGSGDFPGDGRGGYGGAISAYAPIEIRNSTLVSNSIARLNADSPESLGGGLYSDADVLMTNTIIAGNESDGEPSDCSGTVVGLALLTSDGTGCPTAGAVLIAPEAVFTDVLAPLADNGGPTPTHALLAGSLATDAGSCADASTDQRGLPRPVDTPGASNADDACDIGAVENQDGEVVVASGEAPEEGAPLALTVGPNPASGATTLTLSVPAATEATVELFDARGRRVRTLHAGPVSAEGLALRLDTSALPAGVYLLRASTPEAASGARLTVVR